MAIEKYVVSKDDGIYEAWPDLVQTDSGKLICVFAECTHHIDRNEARLVLRESRDRGRTWSPKRYLTDKGTRDNYFNCPRITKLRDGRKLRQCQHTDPTAQPVHHRATGAQHSAKQPCSHHTQHHPEQIAANGSGIRQPGLEYNAGGRYHQPGNRR